MAVDAVQANGAVPQPSGDVGLQLQCGSQLHGKRVGEVFLRQQRQRRAVYPFLPEVLKREARGSENAFAIRNDRP